MKTIALIALLAVGAAAVQDMPEPTKPDKQHEWLQQLVGDWTATAETTMQPGMPPMMMDSTEKVRSIGGLWVVAEGSATFNGSPFTSIMTLGYDPMKQTFVGTWIDTMQTHLWSYVGKLDEAQKVLTLDTKGPSFADPTKTSEYRDAIELKSADHKVLTSSVKGADGTWTTFLRAEFKRKK